MRAVWSGAISFGLVHFPIKLYSATEEKQITFHNLHAKCHTPLVQKRWCPKCQKEVPWEEVEKGYKITKEKWVIFSKEELEKLRPLTAKTIEIKGFVDVTQIDPIFYGKAYYVVPQEGGIKAYSLFAEALRLANKAAIGRVVMRNKEYVVAIRPFKKGLVMHVLYYIGEVRNIDELPELKNLVVVSKEELELAKALISKLTKKEFDMSEFKDTFTEKLREVIKAKAEGKSVEVKEEKPIEEAKSLIEALKASVEAIETKKKKKVEAK
ncbi:MAG TPA: Ku protein [Candidatus Aenigmarchaeota archaeon]|nr:Ku protein [Candidatus Aenigmarchaeota archaeon]